MKAQNSPEGPKRTVYPMQIDSSQQDTLVGDNHCSESPVRVLFVFSTKTAIFLFLSISRMSTLYIQEFKLGSANTDTSCA